MRMRAWWRRWREENYFQNIFDSLPVCALTLWGLSQVQNAILFPDELVVYQVQ